MIELLNAGLRPNLTDEEVMDLSNELEPDSGSEIEKFSDVCCIALIVPILNDQG